MWAFGTGLSYSTFSCTWQDAAADAASSSSILRPTPGEPGSGFLGRFSTEQLASAEGMAYTVVVKNTGKVAGDYVALAFVSPPNATTTSSDHTATAPQKQLFGFGRVSLAPGAEATIDFLLEMGAARGDRLKLPACDRGSCPPMAEAATAGSSLTGLMTPAWCRRGRRDADFTAARTGPSVRQKDGI